MVGTAERRYIEQERLRTKSFEGKRKRVQECRAKSIASKSR